MFGDHRRYSPEEIISRHVTLRFVDRELPVRTLWQVLYEPAEPAMTVSFHVRDGESGEVRSPQLRFSLATGVLEQAPPVPLAVPQPGVPAPAIRS